ncbi:MAG: sulfate adenylyltransferase, partial [Pseudomonadota bacterium]|nr:sulfate adenylyltransferase [Pseudomonadota bacterium]
MIRPHGADDLTPRYVDNETQHKALVSEAEFLPSMTLNSAAAANVVMLGAGYFTPLPGFMNLADAMSVAARMQTTGGLFWPVPLLNLTDNVDGIDVNRRIALRDPNVDGNPVMAVMEVSSIERVSDEQLNTMTAKIFGTLDDSHPGVATFSCLGRYCIAGDVQVLSYSYF